MKFTYPILLIALLACLACEEESSSKSVSVEPGGAVAYGIDGVTFQASDALNTSVSFEMSIAGGTSGLEFVGDVYEVGPQAIFLQDPSLVSVSYDEDLVDGPELNLHLYTAVIPSGPWTPAECEVNENANRINCDVYTLRYFAVAP